MLLKNSAFTNVVQNGVASTRISRGQVINGIQIKMGGTAADPSTHVSRMVLRINEKIVVDLTGAQVESIHATKGLTSTADTLFLSFLEETALNVGSMFTGAHDTSKGVQAYDLEVTLAGAPADVTLESWRDVSPASPNSPGIGIIRSFIPQTLSFTGSGKYSHQPSSGPNKPAKICRLHFLGSTVDAIGIKKNSLHIFEGVPTAENTADLKRWGRVPQADHFCVDFVKRGIIEEAMYTGNARSLEYEVETSGAGDVLLITEQLIRLGDL